MTTPSPIDRAAILDKEVRKYVSEGYRVVSQTDTTAHLVKPKELNFLLALMLLLLMMLPFLIYMLMFMVSRDKTVYLEVDPAGNITRT